MLPTAAVLRRRLAFRAAAALLVVVAACAPPPLRVGSSGDYPPFSLRAADGSWSGFDVEVARAYGRDRGREVVFVPFRWPALDQALADGAFDVAMSGITVRGERLVLGRFTAAVARTRALLLVRPGAPAPQVVAVNRGGHLERLARERLPGVELRALDDNRELLAAVRGGVVDGVVSDAVEAAAPLASGELVVATTLAHDRKAYWLPPGADALAADLDAWLLARERDGTLPALRGRLLGDGTGPPLEPAASWAVDLLGRRLLVMPAVAAVKRTLHLPLDDPRREEEVIARAPDALRALARGEIAAAKAVQRAAQDAPDPGVPLARLRTAIDRLDAALATALADAAPVQAPLDAVLAQLRDDAAVAGAGDEVLRPLAEALRTVPPPR